MRDPETIETALVAAETGHLVFSTLHTLDAPETINRIVAVFPPHQQDQIRHAARARAQAPRSRSACCRAPTARAARWPPRCSSRRRTSATASPIATRRRSSPTPSSAGGSQYGMQSVRSGDPQARASRGSSRSRKPSAGSPTSKSSRCACAASRPAPPRRWPRSCDRGHSALRIVAMRPRRRAAGDSPAPPARQRLDDGAAAAHAPRLHRRRARASKLLDKRVLPTPTRSTAVARLTAERHAGRPRASRAAHVRTARDIKGRGRLRIERELVARGIAPRRRARSRRRRLPGDDEQARSQQILARKRLPARLSLAERRRAVSASAPARVSRRRHQQGASERGRRRRSRRLSRVPAMRSLIRSVQLLVHDVPRDPPELPRLLRPPRPSHRRRRRRSCRATIRRCSSPTPG